MAKYLMQLTFLFEWLTLSSKIYFYQEVTIKSNFPKWELFFTKKYWLRPIF